MRTKEEIMRRIREVVKHNLSGVSHAYLYGSRARGEASVDSDWDVLIILDKPQIDQSDYDNVIYPITSLGWELGEMIIPVLYTKNEWESNSFTPLLQECRTRKNFNCLTMSLREEERRPISN